MTVSGGTRPSVSFEFFPPKTPAAEASLWACFARLAPLAPEFVSVTYGAGGTTRARTHEIVARMRRESSIAPAAHLTCVGATREEIDQIARRYWDSGIRHVVALRGDMPEGAGRYAPTPGGYAYAADLVAGLRKLAPFEISVAAYPEVHPEAVSAKADLDNLKRKIDAGAARAITQFFFAPDCFLRFRERAVRAGITVPIIPGILPVSNFKTVQRFAASTGASIPPALAERFAGLDNDPETRALIASATAIELCTALKAEGVGEFHFYTLNRAELTFAICHALAVRPPAEPAAERAAQ
ncbi:MAG: methylenetetrahydrofolate reductase [NAD(P)H] [Alphaproteobacteria bacterium]|nr:methylenetetrahydrofolate reductase [NAD(P)H] [Alphaproteobacteria bacterium]